MIRTLPPTAFKLNRVELTAAVLLTDILVKLQPTLEKADNIHLWSDSNVTLNLNRHTGIEYIDSRLRLIWDRTQIAQWNHCPTDDNPADLASRRMLATKLLQ
jgi:hypothetical protein